MFDANATSFGAPLTDEDKYEKKNGDHNHDGGDDENVEFLAKNGSFFGENAVGRGSTGIGHGCRRNQARGVRNWVECIYDLSRG